VPTMDVFCDFFISFFPGMLLIYFLSDFEIVPVYLKFVGMNFVLTFYVRFISVARSLHFKFFRLISITVIILMFLKL
jgi:hypothetical protein